MNVIDTAIPDVKIFEPKLFSDHRGFFFESFNQKLFEKVTGLKRNFVQDNHSQSKKGTLRGLHYQLPPSDQGKLVRVTQGEVFDVAVDIRTNSPTFGKWVGVILSAENNRQLWIPEGFAHGFLTLSETAEFLYKTTKYYNVVDERSIRWNDPAIGIKWPAINELLISSKDESAPFLCDAQLEASLNVVSSSKLVELKIIGDQRGSLISIEQGIDVPFDIKRAYYIFNTQSDVSRGFHAHKKLQQLAVCVSGSCEILVDNGIEKTNFRLSSPDKGLLISGLVWREMHNFSKGCVLLVFASEVYEESDYIRNYEEFLRCVAEQK